MRRLVVLVLLILLTAFGPAATAAASRRVWPQYQSPFSPAQAPDYEMTVVAIRQTYPAGPYEQRILRHRHWVVVETSSDGYSRKAFLNEKANTTTDVTTGPRGLFVNIWRGGNASPIVTNPGSSPVKLDQTDQLLGEACQVWETWRRVDEHTGKVTTRRLACVTGDGIQLWWKELHATYEGESGRATRLVRRRVSPGEVRPPANLFSRARLLAWAAKAPPGFKSWVPDHEVRYNGTVGGRVTRRARSWVSDERGENLQVRDEASGLYLMIDRGEDGRPKSLALTLPSSPPTPPRRPSGFATGKPDGVYLGEPCWRGPQPDGDVIISGHWSCLTADGILLYWVNAGRIRTDGTAIYLKRRRVGFREILPLDTPLSDRAWGIRD